MVPSHVARLPLLLALMSVASACSGGDDSGDECVPGDASRAGLVCSESGNWLVRMGLNGKCVVGDVINSYTCNASGYWSRSLGDGSIETTTDPGLPPEPRAPIPAPAASPTPISCQLPAGSWLMSKTLISGTIICPTLADELFLSPSRSPLAVPAGCTSYSDVTELAAGGCAVAVEIDCPDGSKLLLDQDMFDGGFGRLYLNSGGTTCLYQTQITDARP